MTWQIPLSDIDFGPEEEQAVKRVLAGRWLSMGEVTQAFEADFAAHVKARHAIAVTNGTAALHLACLATNLKPSDEVIVPSLTFVASVAAVRYVGATPVFADIASEDDLTLSPDSIESCLTEHTRAILVMHYGGYACDMPRILALAHKHHLAVIEDAAHAPGATLNGRGLGTWGDAGCFSFFSNKNLTTGEGGMLVTNRDDLAERVRLLRSHGMTTLTWDRHRGHAWSYDVTALGYNYRLDEIRAALGQVQLRKLSHNNARRRMLTNLYHQRLGELASDLGLPFRQHPGTSACHLLPVVLPPGVSRVHFMELLKAQGIQTSVHYPPAHRFHYYMEDQRAQPPASLPITETVGEREVTLPLYPGLSQADVEQVVQAAQRALRELHPTRVIA